MTEFGSLGVPGAERAARVTGTPPNASRVPQGHGCTPSTVGILQLSSYPMDVKIYGTVQTTATLPLMASYYGPYRFISSNLS